MLTRYIIEAALLLAAGIATRHLWLALARKASPLPPRPPAVTQLSRKWARAMFHMGYISIEELCNIYEHTPPDPEDEVTTVNLQGPPPSV